MKTLKQLSLSLVAAAALAACQSNGGSEPVRTAAAGGQSTGACKLTADYAGTGKNAVYRCDVGAILSKGTASGVLSKDIPVSFGQGGSYRTNAAARSFGNDDALSCERAVTNALNNLQNRVKRDGGRSLTNVVSYKAGSNGRFDANRFLPAGEADCIVATFQSRAVMRGSTGR